MHATWESFLAKSPQEEYYKNRKPEEFTTASDLSF